MSKRFYITTPIYYVNSVPHIGTGLTTFAADVTARYWRLRGKDPYFLTGTDENGLKVLEAAQAAGKEPQAFVDEIAERFKEIWHGMNIRFDDFIRTTEPRHIRAVQKFFELLREKGHIYLGKYEGWYDVSTETFYKESELVDGKSPEGNSVRWVEEENWFFKMSSFEAPLLEHIEKNPRFILPAIRRNEVVSFIKQGLRDVCISRVNPGWGIPVPGDEGKVVYVWFDALINYLSATGWPKPGWEELWPAEVEWMGKDILTRFHATLWPAMLLGAELPLPETLVGHGWMTMGGEKISKSKGNVVPPLELAKELTEKEGCEGLSMERAVDAVRRYMAATLPFDHDSTFSYEDFDARYNADLANDLGNALNRSLAMAHKFAGGLIPGASPEPEALQAIVNAKTEYEAAMEEYRIDRATAASWELVRFLNKYIDSRAPWALAKAGDPALGGVLRSMLLCLRASEGLIRPTMPSTADAIAAQLNLPATAKWDQIGLLENLPAGTKLAEPQPLFPRMVINKTVHLGPSVGKGTSMPSTIVTEKNENPPSEITIDDFAKVQLRVARILEAEPLEGSEKLMKLQVMIGNEKRQVLAGIKKYYGIEDLVGRQIVIVANLKPAKLMGHESQGMILAADGPDGQAILIQPEQEAPEGAKVR